MIGSQTTEHVSPQRTTNVRRPARSACGEVTTTVSLEPSDRGVPYLQATSKCELFFLGSELDSGGRRISHPDAFQRTVYTAGFSPRPALSPPRWDDLESSSIP